jgi:hypothetical protein
LRTFARLSCGVSSTCMAVGTFIEYVKMLRRFSRGLLGRVVIGFFGNGVASQDVKAGNILLTCDGRAKLGTSPFIALFPEYCWGPRPLLRNPLRLLCNCPQRILVCALN